MLLGILKPMIPYPLLWEGAVRTVGSHLGCIPNCSEVPPPPPTGEPPFPAPPPAPLPKTPPPSPPPPPQGASDRQLVGGGGGSWRPKPRGRPPWGLYTLTPPRMRDHQSFG